MRIDLAIPASVEPVVTTVQHNLSSVAKYQDVIHQDFHSFNCCIPAEAPAILDIGCGAGGIDVYLYRHYKEQTCIWQLDGDEIDPDNTGGYRGVSVFRNTKAVTRAMMKANEVKDCVYLEADPYQIPTASNLFELVISLISWGFHYPIESYLSEVLRVLKPRGTLVMDIREGTRGIQALEQGGFYGLRELWNAGKFTRIVAFKEPA